MCFAIQRALMRACRGEGELNRRGLGRPSPHHHHTLRKKTPDFLGEVQKSLVSHTFDQTRLHNISTFRHPPFCILQYIVGGGVIFQAEPLRQKGTSVSREKADASSKRFIAMLAKMTLLAQAAFQHMCKHPSAERPLPNPSRDFFCT